MIILETSKHIRIPFHKFHWSVAEMRIIKGKKFFQLDCDELGEEAPLIYADENGIVYADDYYDGFEVAINDGVFEQTADDLKDYNS